MKIVGKVIRDDDGVLCINFKYTKDSPAFDVPFEELFEEFEGQKIRIEVLPVKSPEEAKFP